MPLPTIIQGPCKIVLDSGDIYTEGDITLKRTRDTFNPKSQLGNLGARLKSEKVVLSFKPVGILTAAVFGKVCPYGTAAETVASGASAMPGFPVCTKTVVVHSIIQDKKWTFTKAGVTKMPTLNLSAGKTAFGDMEITCIGDVSKEPNAADFLGVISATAEWGTGMNEQTIVTLPWSLAVGGRTTPFDAVGAQEGFELDPGMSVKEIMDENVGIASIVLENVEPKLKFAPNNLTSLQIDELLGWGVAFTGNANLKPGQAIGRGFGTGNSYAAEDFVLTATDHAGRALTVTLFAAGAQDYDATFGVGTHQHRMVQVVPRQAFTAGVKQKMFDLAIA